MHPEIIGATLMTPELVTTYHRGMVFQGTVDVVVLEMNQTARPR